MVVVRCVPFRIQSQMVGLFVWMGFRWLLGCLCGIYALAAILRHSIVVHCIPITIQMAIGLILWGILSHSAPLSCTDSYGYCDGWVVWRILLSQTAFIC